MKKLVQILSAFVVSLGLVGVFGLQPAAAIDPLGAACAKNPTSEICVQKSTASASIPDQIKNIISLLLFVLGVICVIVIIVAGIQYAVAGGDSNQITKAKNSILYAIIGLVVALLAYAIVNFVIQQFR